MRASANWCMARFREPAFLRNYAYNAHLCMFQATIGMTPEQSRAARAWLGWSQLDLAKRANVSLRTVQSFEKGETTPFANNISAMRRSLEESGLRFIFDVAGIGAGIFRDGVKIDFTSLSTASSSKKT